MKKSDSNPEEMALDDRVASALVGMRYNTMNIGDDESKAHVTHGLFDYAFGMAYVM